MKAHSLLLVFLAGAIVGWGAHTIRPDLGTEHPKEILVQHPDPDVKAGSMMTRVRLCRVGGTDLELIPVNATPREYWVISINGVQYSGVGQEVPTPWAEARARQDAN